MSEMNVIKAVKDLTVYGIERGLIEKEDAIFAANSIFDAMKLDPPADFTMRGQEFGEIPALEDILKVLLDDASERGVIEEGIASRDLFDTRLMGILTPRPSEVLRKFHALYQENPKKATDYFYKLSIDSDYIRSYRIAKDKKWISKTKYGDLDITINLSKPEKDPKAIAAAVNSKQDSYPKCLLCPENQGYAGRLTHPARQNIRLVPLTLGSSEWYMQYSPYVYYNEHCIVLSGAHEPMKIDRNTFVRLMDFIKTFPHYTIGSNADLPIVGGSILTHEHFQGGNYTFAMAKAPIRSRISFEGYDDIDAGIVEWPMSVIRLDGADPDRLIELADKILLAWREYSDETADILAYSEKTPHNTITPIARMNGERFELDLVLRNNRTTEEYPLGIFHPHQELHHIKKENIGLIEVMGLAVLPSRLLKEMEIMRDTIMEGKDPAKTEEIASHAEWLSEILEKYPEFKPENVQKASGDRLSGILEDEIGIVFSKVLEHAGVFKDTKEGREAFEKFVKGIK